MSIKLLPINTPPIIGRLHIAYPLIVMLNDTECLPWFYSNFIQLKCMREFSQTSSVDLCFFEPEYPSYNYFFIYHESIAPKIFTECSIDVNALLRDALNHNFYIITELDDFYIPGKKQYQKKHFQHINFIYGYDSESEYFNLLGYDRFNNFVESTASFEEVKNAFQNTDIFTHIYLLKRRGYSKYTFDPVNLCNHIEEYLFSQNPYIAYRDLVPIYNSKTFIPDYAFGMQTYDYLKAYLEALLCKSAPHDFRVTHILWEHKKCMSLRVRFLIDNGYIPEDAVMYDEFAEIEKKAALAKDLMLKYRFSKRDRDIQSLISLLDTIKASEYEALSKLIEAIRKQSSF